MYFRLSMSKGNKFYRFWYVGLVPILFVLSYFYVYHASNTNFETEYYDLYISIDSSSTKDLEKQLTPLLKTRWTFDLLKDELNEKVKKGLYMIPKGASNKEIIHCLQSSTPPAIKMAIGNIRFRHNLTARLCKDLDLRSRAVRRELANETFIQELDTTFTQENVYGIFIQDSLWVYRNATAKEVIKRVHRNWQQFWTEERKELAEIQGLTPIKAMVLASIIQSESQDEEELPTIAGLYFNRLNDEMRLQSDPTIVFSWGTNLRRILKKHLKIKSRYNTYRHKGLPPGPVYTASKIAINAVLNPQEHDYFFFVAHPSFNGKHIFSRTYEEHLEKAKNYRNTLNRKKIY